MHVPMENSLIPAVYFYRFHNLLTNSLRKEIRYSLATSLDKNVDKNVNWSTKLAPLHINVA